MEALLGVGLNTALIFAIPLVMLLVGAGIKALIEGLKMEAVLLGIESSLAALTECMNRIRACLVGQTVQAKVALVGVGLLLVCLMALLLLALIHKYAPEAKDARAWYTKPWLLKLTVGNLMGFGLLVGVLYLMKEA